MENPRKKANETLGRMHLYIRRKHGHTRTYACAYTSWMEEQTRRNSGTQRKRSRETVAERWNLRSNNAEMRRRWKRGRGSKNDENCCALLNERTERTAWQRRYIRVYICAQFSINEDGNITHTSTFIFPCRNRKRTTKHRPRNSSQEWKLSNERRNKIRDDCSFFSKNWNINRNYIFS